MKNRLEQKLSELYIANLDIIGEGFGMPVNSARSKYMETFMLLGLPDAKDERYRHCDMQELFDGEREIYFTPQPGAADKLGTLPVYGYNVSVVNGFCPGGVTEFENGIIFGSLKAALAQYPHIADAYNSVADNETEAVTALNSAFVQDGAVVYIPSGVKAEKPFVLDFGYSSDEVQQMCFTRALVIAGESSKADVVICHRDNGKTAFLVDFVKETLAGENSEVNISELSMPGSRSAVIAGSYVRQAAGSKVNTMNVWLDGGTTRVNSVTDLAGPGADSTLYGLYFGSDSQRIDINMNVKHMVADCNSFELVKGVVSGEAVGAFTGRVHVAKDAQRTLALQQSRNLQLSETSKIYTEPQLEIYADDVKCSHGATVGQMDDDAVLYMRQRGISEADARKLQLSGFVNDVVSRCTIEAACDFVGKLAEDRIAAM